jgi:hypothetical protein
MIPVQLNLIRLDAYDRKRVFTAVRQFTEQHAPRCEFFFVGKAMPRLNDDQSGITHSVAILRFEGDHCTLTTAKPGERLLHPWEDTAKFTVQIPKVFAVLKQLPVVAPPRPEAQTDGVTCGHGGNIRSHCYS